MTNTETKSVGLTYDKILAYARTKAGFSVYAELEPATLELCHAIADRPGSTWNVSTHDLPDNSNEWLGGPARTITVVILRATW